MRKVICIFLYIFLCLSGLILMKLGVNTGELIFNQGILSFSINVISFLGLICYILSFLFFTSIVVKFDLSYIVPLTSGVVQVLTLFSGFFIFNENISIKGIIGSFLIIVGIVIMNIKTKKIKEISA